MAVIKGADGKYHRVVADATMPLAVSSKNVPLADCEHCPMLNRPLCDAARGERVDVLAIGEGPGINEIREQKFYIGRSGQLLRAGLAQVGMGEYSLGFNNATLCYPEGDFPPEASQRCRKRLLAEIESSNPRLIIATGAQALTSLLGEETGIMSVQGRAFEYHHSYKQSPIDGSPDWDTSLLVACLHPAYVLRFPGSFYDFMNTLVKAKRLLDRDPTANVQPEDFRKYIADESNAYQLLQEIASYDNIYADLETTGFNPFQDSIICISMAGRGSQDSIVKLGVTFKWDLFRESSLLGLLMRILEKRVVTYWNGYFDCMFLRQYGIKAWVGHDAMLKRATLDERPSTHGLKPSAKLFCNAPDWEAPLHDALPSRETSYGTLPFELLAQYATLDACYTGTVDSYLDTQLTPDSKFIYEKITLPATNALMEASEHGILIDLDQLERVREELSIQLAELLQKLQDFMIKSELNYNQTIADIIVLKAALIQTDLAIELDRLEEKFESDRHTPLELLERLGDMIALIHNHTSSNELVVKVVAKLEERLNAAYSRRGFNPSSTPQAQHLCYDKLPLRPIRGKKSTARTVIEEYRRDYEPLGWLIDYRSTRKMIGTYLDNLREELDANQRWHPNIRVNGTVTGRLASGRGSGERTRKSLNALGIPKEKGGIKKLIVAPKGKLVMEGDGSQMELRVLGALSKDKNMIADFKSGIEFHGIIRDRVYHRGYDKKNYTHQEVLDAKTLAFGPPYGRGADSIARQLKCTVPQAEEFLESIWGRYTEAMAWLQARVEELRATGEVRSYYGRLRRWGLIDDETFEAASKEARNFPIQSAATDTNLQIMIGLKQEFDKDLIFPLYPIHDSILCYISEARAEEAKVKFKAYAERRAQELLKTDMPFVYDVGIGHSWGDI